MIIKYAKVNLASSVYLKRYRKTDRQICRVKKASVSPQVLHHKTVSLSYRSVLLETVGIPVGCLDPGDVLDFSVTGGTIVAGVFKVVQKEGQQTASTYTAVSVE